MLCDDLDRWDGGWSGEDVQEGGAMCVQIADSLYCTAEMDTF